MQAPRFLDLRPEIRDVSISQLFEQTVVKRVAGARRDIAENDSIGSPCDRYAFERLRVTDKFLTGTIHGSNAGTTGENERAINIK